MEREEPKGPRASPESDPTNPYRQEAVGEWVNAERASERRTDQPGLGDREREVQGRVAGPR